MKTDNIQHYILFDINSSTIGVLVFEKMIDEKGKKTIYHQVFTKRKEITGGYELDAKVFLGRTLSTFGELAGLAHKYSGNEIAEIYINIASPWVSSQKRIVHFEKGKEFIFTKEIADSIIEKELKESLKRTHDFREQGDLAIIERRTVDVFLNGYSAKNPYGVLTQDVDIHSLISVMSKTTKDAFSHVVEKAFHQEPTYFSNIFMNYEAIVSLFPHENNITVMDVSGEMTEISLIVDDHLRKVGTIPVGSRAVVQHLGENLNIPFVKAESLIQMYNENHLDEQYRQTIEKVMKESFYVWFKPLYSFLDEVSMEYLIPETISLLTPEKMQGWFNEWVLKSEELGEHMHAQKKVRLLDIKMLFREKNREELINISDDNLSLCLAFVEKYMIK